MNKWTKAVALSKKGDPWGESQGYLWFEVHNIHALNTLLFMIEFMIDSWLNWIIVLLQPKYPNKSFVQQWALQLRNTVYCTCNDRIQSWIEFNKSFVLQTTLWGDSLGLSLLTSHTYTTHTPPHHPHPHTYTSIHNTWWIFWVPTKVPCGHSDLITQPPPHLPSTKGQFLLPTQVTLELWWCLPINGASLFLLLAPIGGGDGAGLPLWGKQRGTK